MLLNDQLIKKLSDFCENQEFWGYQGQGVGGNNAVSYEEVGLGVNYYMKLKLKLSILYFLYQ